MELQYRRTFHKLLTVRFLDVGEGHVFVAETRLGVPLATRERQSPLQLFLAIAVGRILCQFSNFQ